MKIYCDLDGTLVDFVTELNKVLKTVYGSDHDDFDQTTYDCGTHTYKKHCWDAIKSYQQTGFQMWQDMNMLPEGQKLWDYIKPHNAEILSAVGLPEFNAASQKQNWCAKYLHEYVIVNLVPRAEDKSKYATAGDILIDDKLKAIIPWNRMGGIGILHKTTEQTILELKTLGI